ncbi:hypothetical protein [Streptosporangium sp. NPDC006930]|uniref:hypothetical protein n=1 Tax=Streptosporangium sp. NPDC006930 TaxID=3154783 RepID=UPI0034166ECB
MIFADLLPGVLARIPDAPDPLTPNRPPVLPPAVRILTPPAPCSFCAAVQVLAREVDGGRPHLYHRLPSRAVIHITPAPLEAS